MTTCYQGYGYAMGNDGRCPMNRTGSGGKGSPLQRLHNGGRNNIHNLVSPIEPKDRSVVQDPGPLVRPRCARVVWWWWGWLVPTAGS